MAGLSRTVPCSPSDLVTPDARRWRKHGNLPNGPQSSGLLPQACPRDLGKVMFAKCPPPLSGLPEVVAITPGILPLDSLRSLHSSFECGLLKSLCPAGWMSRCPWWAHLCTRAGVTCGFYAEACCAWLGAILANAVSILMCHIKEIYGILASAKSANMLCFSNSAKSLSSIIYSGNTLYLLISVELHLSSLVSEWCSQEGRLLCWRTTLNIFILVLFHSQMRVTQNYTKPPLLIFFFL